MLPRALGKHRVHDAAAAGYQPGFLQHTPKQLEQRLVRPGLAQRLPKQPNGFGVRHAVVQSQSQKPLKTQPIVDLKLHRVVRNAVPFLQHDDLKHHHAVKRRPSPRPFRLLLKRRFYRCTKPLPVNRIPHLHQLVAQLAQPL
jgi:hypothetical protein